MSFFQALGPICPLSSRTTSSNVQLPNCRYTLLLQHMPACCAPCCHVVLQYCHCCHVVLQRCICSSSPQIHICCPVIACSDYQTTTYAPTPAGFAILTLLFLILFLVSTLSAPKGDAVSGAGTSSDILSGGQIVHSTSAAGSLLLLFGNLAANLGIQSS